MACIDACQIQWMNFDCKHTSSLWCSVLLYGMVKERLEFQIIYQTQLSIFIFKIVLVFHTIGTFYYFILIHIHRACSTEGLCKFSFYFDNFNLIFNNLSKFYLTCLYIIYMHMLFEVSIAILKTLHCSLQWRKDTKLIRWMYCWNFVLKQSTKSPFSIVF